MGLQLNAVADAKIAALHYSRKHSATSFDSFAQTGLELFQLIAGRAISDDFQLRSADFEADTGIQIGEDQATAGQVLPHIAWRQTELGQGFSIDQQHLAPPAAVLRIADQTSILLGSRLRYGLHRLAAASLKKYVFDCAIHFRKAAPV